MDSAALRELLLELFIAIKLIAGYPVPEELPVVHRLPLVQMQKMICRGPCEIRAFYLPEQGVFLNESLDIENDTIARSILLHELVHHVQHVSGRYDSVVDECARWFSKERQAYEIQNAYLMQRNVPNRFVGDSLPFMCGDRSNADTENK